MRVLRAPAPLSFLDPAYLDPGPGWHGSCRKHGRHRKPILKAKSAEAGESFVKFAAPLHTPGPGFDLRGGGSSLLQLVSCRVSVPGCILGTLSAGPFLYNLKDLDPCQLPKAHFSARPGETPGEAVSRNRPSVAPRDGLCPKLSSFYFLSLFILRGRARAHK